jgi:hypothetical protein
VPENLSLAHAGKAHSLSVCSLALLKKGESMDPQATWEQLLEAVNDRDEAQMDTLAVALLEWLKNRGTPPVTIGARKLGVSWHNAVAQFVCYLVKSRQRKSRERRKRQKQLKRWKGDRP